MQVPGAMQALLFARQVYGDTSIELTPGYLILAEANLGTCYRQHNLQSAHFPQIQQQGDGQPAWESRQCTGVDLDKNPSYLGH